MLTPAGGFGWADLSEAAVRRDKEHSQADGLTVLQRYARSSISVNPWHAIGCSGLSGFAPQASYGR
jgi:hypothetical protein